MIADSESPHLLEQVLLHLAGTAFNPTSHTNGLRLITLSGDDDGTRYAEIIHEALLKRWNRLRDWIELNRDNLRIRDRIRDRMRLWQDDRQPNDRLLPRGSELEDGRKLLTVDKKIPIADIKPYIQRSILHHRRRTQIRTRVVAGTILLLCTLSIFAFWQQNIAEKQTVVALKATADAIHTRNIAEQERDIAEKNLSQFLATEAIRLNRADYGSLKLLLATEALNVTHNTRIDNAMRRVLSEVQIQALAGHKDNVLTLAFSKDERWLATGSSDNTIMLWNLRDLRKKPQILSSHVDDVNTLTFSIDGQWLVSGGKDKTIRLWDLSNLNNQPRIFLGHNDSVSSVAISADNHWLVSGGKDKTVRLWDLSNLNGDFKVLDTLEKSVTSVILSTDGRWLAAASRDSTIKLWDLLELDNPPASLESHQNEVYDITFDAQSKWLASGGFEPLSFKVINLWDLENLNASPYVLRDNVGMSELAGSVTSLAFSSEGQLISGMTNDRILLWDVSDLENPALPQILLRYPFPDSLSISTNDSWMAFSSRDGLVRLYNLAGTMSEPKILVNQQNWISSINISDDGRWLATGDVKGRVVLYDLTNFDVEPFILDSNSDRIFAIEFSSDGRWLVFNRGVTLYLLDLYDLESEPKKLQNFSASISSITFSSNNRNLLVTSNKALLLWELDDLDNEPKRFAEHEDSIVLAFFQTDQQLITVTNKGAIKLLNLNDLDKTLHSHQLQENSFSAAAVSSDKKWLALVTSEKLVQLWNLNDLNEHPKLLEVEEVDQLTRFIATGIEIKFSPDNRWLVLAGTGSIVQLWSAQNDWNNPAIALYNHEAPVSSVAFSPDNQWLYSGGFDYSVRLWALTEMLVTEACNRSGRNLTKIEWRKYWGDKAYHRTCSQWPLPHDIQD